LDMKLTHHLKILNRKMEQNCSPKGFSYY